jgi:hypothetical protein
MIFGVSVGRFVAAALAFFVLFVGSSFLINGVWLGPEHEMYAFLRSDDDVRITPGLGISALLWSGLITVGYLFFGARIAIENRFVHGAAFGLLVFVLFILVHEVYVYQFIAFEWIILVGGLLHYLVAFTLGCGLIGVISGARFRSGKE